MTQAPDFFDGLQATALAQLTPLQRVQERIEWTRVNTALVRDRLIAIAEAAALLAGKDRADLVALFGLIVDLADDIPGTIEIEIAMKAFEGGAA